MPAGFWKEFHAELLVADSNNQRGHGGHRAMYWRSKDSTFEIPIIVEFAERNGWKLKDSLSFSSAELNVWVKYKRPVFPLPYEGFSSTLIKEAEIGKAPSAMDNFRCYVATVPYGLGCVRPRQ
jgi:hypothetical protein